MPALMAGPPSPESTPHAVARNRSDDSVGRDLADPERVPLADVHVARGIGGDLPRKKEFRAELFHAERGQ